LRLAGIDRKVAVASYLERSFRFAIQQFRDRPISALCQLGLSPVHTGDYSRRIRLLSPKTATVAEFGDCSGQGFSH